MSALGLLLIQILFAFTALAVLGAGLLPWARSIPRVLALELLLWMHVPRSLPLGLLAPGQVEGVAPSVANAIAWGDFACAALALAGIVALRTSPERAQPWIWAFTVVSCVDIATALALGLGTRVYEQPLGVAWFVLTTYVPIVCVSQAAIVALLPKPSSGPTLAEQAERTGP